MSAADVLPWVLWAVAVAIVVVAARVIVWNSRKAAEGRQHLTDGSLSPRNQHYAFVHSYLRGLAFEDPDRLVIALAAPEADDLLFELWNAVGKDLAQAGEDPGATGSEGLEAVPARVAGRPCALVKLPVPTAATEAYFVAIILNHDIDEPAKAPPEPAVFYFTLEKGVTLEAGERTLLAEWDAAGTHRLLGDAPPADARMFLDHVAHHLTGRAAGTGSPNLPAT